MKSIILKEQFNPRLIGIFTNPFYFTRKGLFKAITTFGELFNGKLLDVGCGTKPYEQYFGDIDWYVGLEIDTKRSRETSKANVFYDGDYLPFQDNEFDCVLCSEVLEHVFNPNEFLAEINRVVKIGGYIVMSVPFVWDEHEQPRDYARYTSFGLQHLLLQNGFNVLHNVKTGNDVSTIFQLINEYIYKITYVKNPYLRQLLNTVLISPVTILGIIVSAIFPKSNDLYLNNVILAKCERKVG